jgi:spermidine dehydrogenase
LLDYSQFLPLAPGSLSAQEAVARMPLGENARRELLRLLEARENRVTDVPIEKREAFLWRLSYREFLEQYMGVRDPQLFAVFQGLTTDSCASIERASALGLMTYVGLPGIKATGLRGLEVLEEPYIHHFPDGNASIARLLVRRLIPGIAPGASMEDVVPTRFDYTRLDEPDSKVRLRLSSTVVRVEHEGPVSKAERVSVTYIHGGRAHRVRTRACVLAGYNRMIRHLCPELSKAQREALAVSIKAPLVYTNVLLRDWSAWKKLSIGFVAAPASYHAVAFLDYPTSMGGYEHAQEIDQPIVVHMERFPKGSNAKASRSDQHRAGRREMFSESFEHIERETRRQLAGILSAGGFDPARDIAAMTVNRWPHGYANWSSPFESGSETEVPPHVRGRTRFGRIAIANSDAGARATIDSAIDQAHRAIGELSFEPRTGARLRGGEQP